MISMYVYCDLSFMVTESVLSIGMEITSHIVGMLYHWSLHHCRTFETAIWRIRATYYVITNSKMLTQTAASLVPSRRRPVTTDPLAILCSESRLTQSTRLSQLSSPISAATYKYVIMTIQNEPIRLLHACLHALTVVPK